MSEDHTYTGLRQASSSKKDIKHLVSILSSDIFSGRHGGVMVSALDSGLNGALRCVFGQDTLLS